ncbi:serine/threonine protein kinase, partial [bacterium]|nr:serine/threonine protein kinase [bacterium]
MASLESIGPFTGLEHAASGVMAETYRAECPEHGPVILRVPKPGAHLDRARADALAHADFQHPNIVTFLEVSAPGEPEYVAMERLEAPTLHDIIEDSHQTGLLSPRIIIQTAIGVCQALEHAYANSPIRTHRDIRPGTIFVEVADDEARSVKLSGFGVFRPERKARGERIRFPGPLRYEAPERFTGKTAITQRADIYALGAVLYECATASAMFEGEPTQVVDAHINVQPIPPSTLRPDIPPNLEAIILRCVSKDPGDRYDDVPQLTHSLRRLLTALEQNEGHGRVFQPGAPLWGVRKRRRLRPATLAGFALLLGGAALAVVL